jgi:hypothetical protein
MSYDSLDLNINNYTVEDLEQFFKLNPSITYTPSDIEYKEVVIRKQLFESGHINKKFKSDLIDFLQTAKNILIEHKCPSPPPPTSIPPNFRLDTTPHTPILPPSHNRTQELIYKSPILPIHTTNGNNYYQGQLNPIETRTKTTNICIDTLFRKNYDNTRSTEYTYQLPKNIQNVVSMKITSIEIPITWYRFSNYLQNNTMLIYLYNMNGFPDNSFNIIIPDGNYTGNNFAIMLNNIFGYIGNGLNFLWCEIETNTLSTVIRARNILKEPNSNGPFPFSEDSVNYSPDFYFVLDFSLPNRPLYRNLGWMLGFKTAQYTVRPTDEMLCLCLSTPPSVLYKCFVKSESVFGNTKNYFFIEIDDFQNNFPTDSIISSNGAHGNYLGKNIIAKIIIRYGINNINTDNASDCIFKKRDYFGPVNLEKFKIRVLSRFGEVIDNQKNDWSMTLEITSLQMNTSSFF